MTIKNFLVENNKESRGYEYTSKNFDNFIAYTNQITEELKTKNILQIKLKMEVEYTEKGDIDDDFP